MYAAASILGSVVLVFYTFPYLGIIFLPLVLLYYLVSSYYRRTSVETKRLESILRSTLYSSFSGKLCNSVILFLISRFVMQKL
jgi:ATP-binding cassette subfamily C (CFTR/MRP) protein 1